MTRDLEAIQRIVADLDTALKKNSCVSHAFFVEVPGVEAIINVGEELCGRIAGCLGGYDEVKESREEGEWAFTGRDEVLKLGNHLAAYKQTLGVDL